MEHGAVYRFGDVWRLAAAPERVAGVLLAVDEYPQWWPEVRAVAALGHDDARAIVRSRLPYTLDLRLRAVSRELPNLVVRISGDLTGWIRFDVRPDGAGTVVRYSQEVAVHGAMAFASPLLRPAFRWNHARMMANGRTALEARAHELTRAEGA